MNLSYPEKGTDLKINATAVYADLQPATSKPVEIRLWDEDLTTRLLIMSIEYQKGRITSPYVKLTFTNEDLPKIKKQGIPTKGLTHFIHALDSKYDQKQTEVSK